MKKYIYITIAAILSVACGEDSLTNKAPTTPNLSYPTDNLICLEKQVNLRWDEASDENEDAITYNLEVATDPEFAQMVYEYSGSGTLQTLVLENEVAYYWRVQATDGQEVSGYSPIFRFYTEGTAVQNHLPFAPIASSPELGSIVESGAVVLEWSASDPDAEDTLLYDVYFGTSDNPTSKIEENSSSTTKTVNTLSSENYYWKVVVKDNNGGETVGQIWNFETN
jgi:hypothetical protein